MKKLVTGFILFFLLFTNYSFVNAGIFDDAENWTYSPNLREDDFTYEILRMIPTIVDNTETNKHKGYNLSDINGDGLVDVLYYSFIVGNSNNSYNSLRQLAIFYNKGDYRFGIGYKCMEQFSTNGAATIPVGFYGDCAQQ